MVFAEGCHQECQAFFKTAFPCTLSEQSSSGCRRGASGSTMITHGLTLRRARGAAAPT